MTISDSEKIDFLWKMVIYGTSKTANALVKSGSNETVASPTTVNSNYVWTQASSIPTVPPANTTSTVDVYYGSSTLQCTNDPTSPANQTWFTTTTYGNTTTQIGNFIPPTYGSNYLARVWVGNPNTGPAARVYPDTTGYEYVFDYVSGTLNFDTGIPSGVTATVGTGTVSVAANGIYIQAYQYTGTTLASALTSIASSGKSTVVANIAARNALTPNAGDRVHVLDASAIATDAAPGQYADYVWDGSYWVLTSSEDSARSEQNITMAAIITPSSNSVVNLGTVGQNTRAVEVSVAVTSAFDGTFELSIGDSVSNSRLMAMTENDLSTVGNYLSSPVYEYPSGADTPVNIYLTGTATVGSASVVVTFA